MGVGPEVSLKALSHAPSDVVVAGSWAALQRANEGLGLTLHQVDHPKSQAPEGTLAVWQPTSTEPVEVAAIRAGAQACMDGTADALVTGPIHKAKLAAQGFQFRGHTDFLGHLCGGQPAMAFVGETLRVVLVTTHIPLARVPESLRTDEVLRVTELAARALQHDLGLAKPRVVVCGLNPHAGEGGLLGTEDQDIIAPAVAALSNRGWDATGPVSAEGAFLAARRGEADLVVAMYHDQGLAPLKVLEGGRAVNWTLGLPIVRTSVDHGTADDLVGTGRADASSMVAALQLATAVIERRQN